MSVIISGQRRQTFRHFLLAASFVEPIATPFSSAATVMISRYEDDEGIGHHAAAALI